MRLLTIHSELVLEVVNNLVKIIGTTKYKYNLMEHVVERLIVKGQASGRPSRYEIECSPDIIVYPVGKKLKQLAIEVESDINFDFDASMRQIKKYKHLFKVVVIIPNKFEKFAKLYLNDDIKVFLWSAIRIWRCRQCGSLVEVEGLLKPKCSKENKWTEHILEGIKNFKLKEYIPYQEKV